MESKVINLDNIEKMLIRKKIVQLVIKLQKEDVVNIEIMKNLADCVIKSFKTNVCPSIAKDLELPDLLDINKHDKLKIKRDTIYNLIIHLTKIENYNLIIEWM